jgi:Right handed beta helix region
MTTYYVSPTGSNSANGTSTGTAWQTVSKVNGSSFSAGDSILFQGGQTFSGTTLTVPSSGTAVSPITFGSYGTGNATISVTNNYAVLALDKGGLVFDHLTVSGTAPSGSYNGGIHCESSSGTHHPAISVTNCIASGFQFGIAFFADSNTDGFDAVTITGCTCNGNTYGGIWLASTLGTPSVQGFTTITITGNTCNSNPGQTGGVTDSSGYGIFIQCATGGTVSGNTCASNGASNPNTGSGGVCGIITGFTSGLTISNNLVYNQMGGTLDGDGIDLDTTTSNCIVEYNLIYGCVSAGIFLFTTGSGWSGNVIRYNITWGNCQGSYGHWGELTLYGDTLASTQIYNNTFIGHGGGSCASGAMFCDTPVTTPSAVTIRNNIFYSTIAQTIYTGTAFTTGQMYMQGNCYYYTGGAPNLVWGGSTYTTLAAWQTATGQEKLSGTNVGVLANPQLTAAGTGPTVTTAATITSYTSAQVSGSGPCAGTALPMLADFGINPGAQDFYGNGLASPYWIGAYQPVSGGGGGSIAYRTGSAVGRNNGTTSTTSWSFALSASIVQGDLVVVAFTIWAPYASWTNQALSVTGGGVTWVSAGTPGVGGSSGWAVMSKTSVFTAIAGATTPGATLTVTIGSGTTSVMGVSASYSGASAGVDLYATTLITSPTGATSAAEPSGSTTTANDWLIGIIGLPAGSTATITPTLPTDTPTGRVSTGSTFWEDMTLADSAGAVTAGAHGGGTWSWSGGCDGVAALIAIKPGVTAHTGTAALIGSGTLTGAGVFAGTATPTGLGSLTGLNAYDALYSDSYGGSAITAIHTHTTRGIGSAALSGAGTLTGAGAGIFLQTAVLTGIGALSGTWIGTLVQPPAVLAGRGSLGVSGWTRGFPAALIGQGTLSVLQATGGLVFASPGAAIPQAYPGSSQIAVAAPGSSNWMYLGTIGICTALKYSFVCPGGADKLTATIMVPATYRTQLFNPGWQVRVGRGGHIVWTGRLDEPVPTPTGWNLTAVGDGQRGTDFLALYTSTWPSNQPDESINLAVTRGLPWVNPGVGTPSGAWFGQAIDPGGQTITALLNLVCTRGQLTWYANSQPGGQPGTDLSVFPLPTTPNRLLIVSDVAPRTLGGDINTIVIRYQASADNSGNGGTAATYSTVTATNAASVTAHGVIETYIDLSDVGVQSSASAKTVGDNILAIYKRASFTTAISGHYGDLMTMGGVPIDPGTDQAATCCRAILCDYGYGGEVAPGGPIQFVTGAYEWDDFAQTFTLTPMVTLDQSLTGMLSATNTAMTPITVAG